MGTLFQEDKASKTIRCPECNNFISSDAASCRFCGLTLTPEMLEVGVEKETEEIRQVQIGFHKTAFWTGLATLAIGTVLMGVSLVSLLLPIDGVIFPWSPVIFVAGLGQLLYSLYGFYQERPRKKKR